MQTSVAMTIVKSKKPLKSDHYSMETIENQGEFRLKAQNV
jgi:hypothetical protein